MLTLSVEGTAPPDMSLRREVSVWRDASGQVCARLYSNERMRWIDWPGIGLFAFTRGRPHVQVWPARGVTASSIEDFLLRRLQPAILQAMGCQALHASASLAPEGVVAFCGCSGSGKSTLAYALRQVGWPQVADDGLALIVGTSNVLAQPVPFIVDLRPESGARLAAAGTYGTASLLAPQALGLILLLSQDPTLTGPPIAERLEGPVLFRSLLAHAHAFDPVGEADALVRDYLAIVSLIPVFTLRYRPSFEELDALIDAVRSLVGAAVPSRDAADVRAVQP